MKGKEGKEKGMKQRQAKGRSVKTKVRGGRKGIEYKESLKE